jgi:hypothetical protein
MTDTTYQVPNLTLEAQNVLTALHDLALATRRLLVAAFFRLAQYRQPDPLLTRTATGGRVARLRRPLLRP